MPTASPRTYIAPKMTDGTGRMPARTQGSARNAPLSTRHDKRTAVHGKKDRAGSSETCTVMLISMCSTLLTTGSFILVRTEHDK